MTAITIQSVQQLQNVLNKYNIPIEFWGKEKAKTINHLYNEIDKDETTLIDRDGMLFRLVNALFIFIYDDHGKIF